MNVEVTAYVDVPGDDEKAAAEIQRISERFADVLVGRYAVTDDGSVRSMVVVKSLPRRWARLSEDEMVGRMLKRAAHVVVPLKKGRA